MKHNSSHKTKTPLHIQLQEQREKRHREYAGMITQSDFNGYNPSNAPIPLTYTERELAHQQSDFYDDTYEDALSLDATMTTYKELKYGGIK